MGDWTFWLGFNAFIVAMLAIDLGVFNKRQHEITFREAIAWVVFWTCLALIFNGLVYYWHGAEKAFEFMTGYIIEWSLSVDNLFVFIVIFSYFNVPRQYQHRVLFWGIVGALLLRGFFILAGVTLFGLFEWMSYVFGAILLITGARMLLHKEGEDPALDRNPVLRLIRKIFPVSDHYEEKKFFTRINGKTFATPLFMVLVMVEFTDMVFAVDSIPAVLSVTRDPFIVYSSNVFAILGLRSMYFALSGMMDIFKYLKTGLAIILGFVGIKMLIHHWYQVPIEWTLITVVGLLALSILFSLYKRENSSSQQN